MSNQSDDNLPDGVWNFIQLPATLTDRIVGWAGLSIYNATYGALLHLVETPQGWSWTDMVECRDKTKAAAVNTLSRVK